MSTLVSTYEEALLVSDSLNAYLFWGGGINAVNYGVIRQVLGGYLDRVRDDEGDQVRIGRVEAAYNAAQ